MAKVEYTTLGWADDESGGTELDAANLNHMDVGIKESADAINEMDGKLSGLNTKMVNLEETVESGVTAIEEYAKNIVESGRRDANTVNYYGKPNIDNVSDALDDLYNMSNGGFIIMTSNDFNIASGNQPNSNGDYEYTISPDEYYCVIAGKTIIGFYKGDIPLTLLSAEDDNMLELRDDGLYVAPTDLSDYPTKLDLLDYVDVSKIEYRTELNPTIETIKDALDYLMNQHPVVITPPEEDH